MPRPRYPSDDRRLRQRPHVKVHLSTRSHPRYGHVFEDPESRGMAWGLWLLAVQYHAARTGNEVTLGQGDLVWLTGRSQRAPALNALRTLCERLEYPMRVEGRRVVVTVRNLQRKQGFNSATPAETTRTSAASEEPKNQGTEEPKNREKNGASAPAVRTAPDPLPLEEIEGAFAAYGKTIRTWNPSRRKALVARCKEHGAEALASAVHGYVYFHRKPGNGFDPMAHLTPETVFQAGKFPKYLEAAHDARAAGKDPPFRIQAGGSESIEERAARLARGEVQ